MSSVSQKKEGVQAKADDTPPRDDLELAEVESWSKERSSMGEETKVSAGFCSGHQYFRFKVELQAKFYFLFQVE